MRCFLAIELSEEAREELLRVQKRLPESKMKLVEPENLHLTLKFFGELSDFQVNKVKEVLEQIKFEKFKVRLSTLGIFPSQKFIRVVWVSIEPKEQLIALQQSIDEALHKEGFKRDRSFETHITLARVKQVKDKEALLKRLKETKVRPIEFEIKGFVLKKSTLTEQGPIYEDIIKF